MATYHPSRPGELEAEIRSLTALRAAQPPDSTYATVLQMQIDHLAVELFAWWAAGPELAAVDRQIHDATRRLVIARAAHTRWPYAAAPTGGLAAVLIGVWLAVPVAPWIPQLGGGLAAVAAACVGLADLSRRRSAHRADQAKADIADAQDRYAAIVARYRLTLDPVPALPAGPSTTDDSVPAIAPAPEGATPCTRIAAAAAPPTTEATDTAAPTTARPAAIAGTGPQPTVSPTRVPATSATESAHWPTAHRPAKAS